jgi:hypothetical protein
MQMATVPPAATPHCDQMSSEPSRPAIQLGVAQLTDRQWLKRDQSVGKRIPHL